MMASARGIRGTALSLAVAASVAAFVLVLAACALAVTGTSIGRGMNLVMMGALGSSASLIHELLARIGMLIMTGLAAALAFRIRLYNFGAEGQLQAGALVAVGIASVTAAWPTWAVLPLQLVAGALAGGIIMFGATLLRLRRRVDEGIVTLLINFIMVLIADLALDGRLGIGPSALASGVPLGLVIALACAVLIAGAIHFTVWGFGVRATAGNAEAARYAGIPVARVTLRVGILSGALAGLAGVCLLADTGSAQYPGLGYAGIAVAVLARLSPIGSVLAGLFVGTLMVGAEVEVQAGASAALPNILVALTLLASLVGLFIRDRVAMMPKAAP